MKVVLKQDVKNIGKKDEMHEVSDGYARNFLLPRGLAVVADASAMNEVKSKQASQQHHKEQQEQAARALAEKLKDSTVVIKAKGGQSGRLFGAVTQKDVSAELEKMGMSVDKRKISFSVREIKDYGKYEAEAKIMQGISAVFTVSVEE